MQADSAEISRTRRAEARLLPGAREDGPERAAPTWTRIPLILPRRARRRAVMRAAQPVGQQAGSFLGRWPIKWHERGRDARHPHDVCAPAISRHPRDLDQVGTSGDRFFKTMDWMIQRCRTPKIVEMGKRAHSCSHQPANQAKTTTKARQQSLGTRSRRTSRGKKSHCRCVHKIFTEHPQVFHSGTFRTTRTMA